MYIQTDLMTKVFSGEDKSFNDSFQASISEAVENGEAQLSFSDMNLNFAASDEGVVIEDTVSNEVTLATFSENGEVELHAYSATQPDVTVPRAQGTDGKHLPNDSTVPVDTSDPSKNEKDAITIEAGITDPDKAGVGKHFSVCFNNFESEDEARAFADAMLEDDENMTFSDDELENVAFSCTELQQNVERLQGTGDLDLAYQVLDDASTLRAYSVLAENVGHDMNDVIESCDAFSEIAEDILMDGIANMDVNEYFSNLDEDEATEYFSNLDEVTADVLYSALQDEENYTFSEVEEMTDAVNAEIELAQPAVELFSELDDEEADAFFSQFTDNELNYMNSAIEEDPNISFSELNEGLEELNMPLDEMFSDFTEDDFNDMFSEMDDDEVELFSDLISDEEDTFTYSDYLDCLEDLHTFSDDDAQAVASNATELSKAAADLEKTKDPELAKKVKLLADKTVEDAEKGEKGGCDTKDVKEMCSRYSELAADILDANGIDPESVNFSYMNEDEINDLFSDPEFDEYEDVTGVYSNASDFEQTYLTAGEKTFSTPAIDTPTEAETKVFANLDDIEPGENSGLNYCLTSKIN